MNAKKLALVFALLLTATVARAAAPNDLTAALQRGLFEEEANRNLDAAMAAYQSLVGQFDKDRQIAATAVFRLGECYRKLGKTNEAVLQYERIVKEFADQPTLATLSRQNLTGLGANRPTRSPTIEPAANTLSPAARAEQRRLLEEEIKLVEQKLGDQQTMVQSGVISPSELVPTQRDVLELRRRLVGLSDEAPATIGSTSSLDGLQSQYALLKAQLEQARKETNDEAVARLFEDQRLLAAVDNLLKAKRDRAQYNDNSPLARSRDDMVKVNEILVAEARKRLLDYQELRLRILESAIQQTKAAAAPQMVSLDIPTTNDEDQEIRRIQAMIQNSPDLINAPAGEGGQTPLITAASKGQLTVARYLLDHGANVNARAGDSSTALQLATFGGHKAMVELLLSRGADVNARRPANSTGTTALHIASDRGFKSVVEVLLANKAEVNFLAKQSTGSRYYAGAGTPLILAARGGHLDTAKLLLQSKANPNLADTDGTTALHEAARQGHRATAEALLDAGADVNAANPRQGTPLLLAAEGGHLEMVNSLLARGAKVDARRDSNSYWPLLTAVGNGHVAVVKSLLEHKADPNLVGPDSPVGIAVQKGSTEILELLLQHDANPNLAPMVGNRAVPFPLLLAAGNDKAEAVALLLKFKADPNQRTVSGGETVLQYAITRPQIVKLLLEAGANPNARDGERRTPLLRAVDQGDLESADLLLQHGADANESARQGFTPLHTAVANNNQPMVELLLKNKADPNRLDETGRTPLDLAKPSRNSSIPWGVPMPQPGRQLRLPGAIPGMPGGMPGPGIASGTVSQASTNDMVTLLRQHGALDDLPQWDRITVRRASVNFSQPVFGKGTNDWNRFNLLELVAVHYNLVSDWAKWSVNYRWTIGFGLGPQMDRKYGDKSYKTRLTTAETTTGIPFPDLSKIVIRRSTADGKEWKSIPVNLAEILSSGECDKAPWLEWGDIVEVPESDHLVDDVWLNFNKDNLVQFKKCLMGVVKLLIKGETKTLTLTPDFTDHGWTANRPYSLVPVLNTSGLIRASSDLSKVKVTRVDPAGGPKKEWVLDCSDQNRTPDLWLRNGDVIEVPEKP